MIVSVVFGCTLMFCIMVYLLSATRVVGIVVVPDFVVNRPGTVVVAGILRGLDCSCARSFAYLKPRESKNDSSFGDAPSIADASCGRGCFRKESRGEVNENPLSPNTGSGVRGAGFN